MLPNRFPDEGQAPEHNTVDATQWYFEAIRAYYALVGDNALIVDLFPVLKEIVDWHVRGTRTQIHVDPADGLLYAGEPGVQLTWMDAKVDEWVVTPRIGKPVEVNALWYNALCIMAEFARLLGEPPERYETLAEQARAGFARFWNEEAGYLYDVLDGPEGNDPALARSFLQPLLQQIKGNLGGAPAPHPAGLNRPGVDGGGGVEGVGGRFRWALIGTRVLPV